PVHFLHIFRTEISTYCLFVKSISLDDVAEHRPYKGLVVFVWLSFCLRSSLVMIPGSPLRSASPRYKCQEHHQHNSSHDGSITTGRSVHHYSLLFMQLCKTSRIYAVESRTIATE